MDDNINTKREETALPSCFVRRCKKKFQETAMMSVRLIVTSGRKLASAQIRVPPLFLPSYSSFLCQPYTTFFVYSAPPFLFTQERPLFHVIHLSADFCHGIVV